jgi:hypothetical protein
VIKTILLPLASLESDKIALDTAVLAARAFDAHMECLHVRHGAVGLAARAIPTHGERGTRAGRILMERWKELQSGSTDAC